MPRIPFELMAGPEVGQSPVGLAPARRSLVALFLLVLGFLVSREAEWIPPPAWLAGAGATAAAALLTKGWACRAALAAGMLLLAAGWFAWRVHQTRWMMEADYAAIGGAPRESARGPAWLDPVLVRAEGVVLDVPRPHLPPRGSLARFFRVAQTSGFTLRLTSLAGPGGTVPASWLVRVSVPIDTDARPAHRLRAGDGVRLSGHLALDGPALNPGEPDRRRLGAQDGVLGRLRVPSWAVVQAREVPAGMPRVVALNARLTGAARERARGALTAIIGVAETTRPDAPPSPGRALLAAMLLGEREPGLDDADRAFRRLGLVHLVAISGFNLAILAGLALFIVRLTGDRGRLEPMIVAAIVISYMAVVPAEAPVLRAGITLLVFLITEAIGVRYDRLTLLGWIAIGLLLWRPMDAWSLGFQLSFGIVAVLLWLSERTTARIFGVELRGVLVPRRRGLRAALRDAGSFIGERLRALISTSLLAWCVAMPVIAHHTGVVSPLAVLTTILVLPLTVVVLWAGYIALLIGVVWPGGGERVSDVLGALGDFLAGVVMRMDAVPGMSVSLPRLSAAWAIVATACVLAWFRWWHVRQPAALAATALVVLWLVVELALSNRLRGGILLRVDTLAVADASCHLVRCGDETILWDGGSSSPGFGLVSLPRIARETGVRRVRTAVVTHANLDHFGILADAAPGLGIERVLVCGPFLQSARQRPRAAAGRLIDLLEAQGVRIDIVGEGDELVIGEATLRFLSPPKNAAGFESINDTSLVGLLQVRTRAGARRVMFTGDVGPLAIRAVRDRYPDLSVDVLEVPHHGSFNHESSALVQAIDPRVVLQSTGRQRVGDPRWESARAGRAWRCTAAEGMVTTLVGRDGVVRVRTRLAERGLTAGRIP